MLLVFCGRHHPAAGLSANDQPPLPQRHHTIGLTQVVASVNLAILKAQHHEVFGVERHEELVAEALHLKDLSVDHC